MLVKFAAYIVCASVVFLSGVAKAGNIQPVYSLKNLGEQEAFDGVTYMRTQVKCNTRTAFSYILNKKRSKEWCIEGNESSCFNDRIEAATDACTNELVVAKKESPKSTEVELRVAAERTKLEGELLLTQERKIEVKERQLELRKKELKLIELQGGS